MVRYKIYSGFGYIGKLSNKSIARGFQSIKAARAKCYQLIWNEGAYGQRYFMVYDQNDKVAGVAYQSHKGHRGSYWVDGKSDGVYILYADGTLGEIRGEKYE